MNAFWILQEKEIKMWIGLSLPIIIYKLFSNFSNLLHSFRIVLEWMTLWHSHTLPNQYQNQCPSFLQHTCVVCHHCTDAYDKKKKKKNVSMRSCAKDSNSCHATSKGLSFHGRWGKERLIQWTLLSVANTTECEFGLLGNNVHQWRCWHLR